MLNPKIKLCGFDDRRILTPHQRAKSRPSQHVQPLMQCAQEGPGVGPVVALTYRATVDIPARFRKSSPLRPRFIGR